MKSITRTALALVAFLTPAFASADAAIKVLVNFGSGDSGGTFDACLQDGYTYIECLGMYVIYLINGVLVPVLFAVAFIVFLYGIAQAYIFSKGDEGAVTKGHQLMLWGLIGFAVMISVWGLVNIVVNTLDLWGYSAPYSPVSYPTD